MEYTSKTTNKKKRETIPLSLTDSYLNHYFDHIYVINLKFKVAKRLIITKHLKQNGIDFETFEAVDGNKGKALRKYKEYQNRELGHLKRYSEYSEKEKERSVPYIESAGAIGIIYSFLGILEDAKKKGYKRFLVFEDDILLSKNFESDFKSFIVSVDDDWKMLQLGASQYGWESTDLETAEEQGFYFPRNIDTCGAFAIAFDSTVIDELIEAESAFESPFDYLPIGEIYERYLEKCFVAYPNIVMPDVADSSIRGKRDQLSHSERMKWKIENFDYPLRKSSISIVITNKNNLKYYTNFSKTKQLPFNLRLYFNSSDGMRPLHNIELLDNEKNKILPINEDLYLPESDYSVTIDEEEVLTESDIVNFIEYKLGIRKKNKTPLEEIEPHRGEIKKDRVSVIIPTYKRPKNLKDALASVVEQDYQDIEVIVVCDNGKDSEYTEETKQIVSSFDGRNDNCSISLLEHSVNRNGAAARNTGILHSTGEYICFLDDDDIYLQGRLSKSIDVLKDTNNTIGAVYCGCLDDNSPENDLSRYKTGDLTLEILLLEHAKNYLNTDTATYKREAVLAINGFDESYYRHQDLEFNLRFFELYIIETIKECLAQRNPDPYDAINQVYDVQMLELKQKFLNQFSHIIETYDQNMQKSIYEVNWAEAKRLISDKDAFIDKLSEDYEEKLIHILDCADIRRNKLMQDALMNAIESMIKTPLKKNPIQKYKAYKSMIQAYFDTTKHSKF